MRVSARPAIAQALRRRVRAPQHCAPRGGAASWLGREQDASRSWRTLGARGTALVRRRHGVAPTPAGEALLEHAREMLASVGRIERDMAAFGTGIRGTRAHAGHGLGHGRVAGRRRGRLPAGPGAPRHPGEHGGAREPRGGARRARAARRWASAGMRSTCRACRRAATATTTWPSWPTPRTPWRAASVRFADVLGHQFVSMPALSAVQRLLCAPRPWRAGRWSTACRCPTSTLRCAWCAPTWPSA